MRLKDTGLTAAELKAQVKKYMIETYERMDFVADYAEGVYMYDENGEAYLDFYAGIAVNCLGNCNPKVVKAIQDQAATIIMALSTPFLRQFCPRKSATPSAWTRFCIRTPVLRLTKQ